MFPEIAKYEFDINNMAKNFTKFLMNRCILNIFRASLCIMVFEIAYYEFDDRITNF